MKKIRGIIIILIVIGVGITYFLIGSGKGSLEKAFEKVGITEDMLLKNDMEEVIEDYRDENEDADEWDISMFLSEEYGENNAIAYFNGALIDADMSQEEMDSIAMRLQNDVLFPFSQPRRVIVNPIDNTNDLEPIDRPLHSLKKDEFAEEDFKNLETGPRFYLDTEGFEKVEGLHIGYPTIEYYSSNSGDSDSEDDDNVSVHIHVAIQKDMEAKAFIDKLDQIEVNGKNIGDIYTDLRESDKMAVKNSVVMIPLNIPFEDIFPDADVKSKEDQERFWKHYADYGNPIININDVEMKLEPVTIDVLHEGIYMPE